MELFVFVFVVVMVIIFVGALSSDDSYAGLMKRGIPARGILLQVDSVRSGAVGQGLEQLQKRRVTIDIEVPGERPHERTLDVLIPLNLVRDVLPGATVELRLSSNRKAVLVAGPGVGFNSAALRTQGRIDQGAA